MLNTIARKLTGFFLVLFLFSCNKSGTSDCTAVEPSSEAGAMTAFCETNNINYTVDENGIYYEIITQGSGSTPGLDSVIKATYTATFLNGTVLEQNDSTGVEDYLYNFIEGWRLAIPYIQEGGRIKMVIPSSLAYGCTGFLTVPPNTPLYFDLVLVDVH